MNNIINNAFKHKNGATRYTHIKVGRNKSHFTSDPLNGDNKYTANDICKMIEFLVDNIYVRFGGQLFRQMVGIPMGTNCAPLLADLFLYSYENEFLDTLIIIIIIINNKKRSHTQLDSRKQVIAFQDRVITINIKEAQHPLK